MKQVLWEPRTTLDWGIRKGFLKEVMLKSARWVGINTLMDPPDKRGWCRELGGQQGRWRDMDRKEKGPVRKRKERIFMEIHMTTATTTSPTRTRTYTASDYLTWKQMEGELAKTKGLLTGLDPSLLLTQS